MTMGMLRSGYARALFAILLVAAVLRVHHLGAESLWLDEAYAVTTSEGSLAHIVSETSMDVHPPAYYFALHDWMRLAGRSEAGARSLSLLFSLGAILVASAVAARFFDRLTALVTAALLAISPFQIEFAQEARMYALLALLGAASTYCFVSLFDRRRRPFWLAGYVVVTTVMMYTHVYSVFVIAGQAATIAAQLLLERPSGRRVLWPWLTAQAIDVVLFAPWISVLHAQTSRVERGFWIPERPWAALLQPILTYSGSVTLAVIMAAIAVFGWLRMRGDAPSDASIPRPAVVLLPWLACPIALPFVLSQIGSPIFLPKYTIAASIPFAMFVARGVAGLPSRALRAFTLAAIVVLSFWPLRSYFDTTRKNDWRGAAARVESLAQPNDVVLFYRSFNQVAYDYYRRRGDLVERPFPLDDEHPTTDALAAIVGRAAEDHRRVWFVTLDGEPLRPAIVAAFERSFTRETQGVWTGVDVDLFTRTK